MLLIRGLCHRFTTKYNSNRIVPLVKNASTKEDQDDLTLRRTNIKARPVEDPKITALKLCNTFVDTVEEHSKLLDFLIVDLKNTR